MNKKTSGEPSVACSVMRQLPASAYLLKAFIVSMKIDKYHFKLFFYI